MEVFNIKKILTALGNPEQNLQMKKENLNIVSSDIQYKEGIIEYLNTNSDIDYIILNQYIPGKMQLGELIILINKFNNRTKIILIGNSSYESKSIIHKMNKFDINEIKNVLKDDNIFLKKQLPINTLFENQVKRREGKIITILGTNGIGKSIFSIIFSKNLKGKKILIIDFDVFNNSLHTLLGVKEYSKKVKNNLNIKIDLDNFNIKDFIVSSKGNISLVSGINLLINDQNKVNPGVMKNLINRIKSEYDFIIIDTSSECFLDYTKEMIRISDQSIFISGANILELKKTKRLLDIYKNEWNIERKKINIVFNKYTSNSVSDEVLRNLFKNYSILGKIKLSDYYDLAVNRQSIGIEDIKNELDSIQKKVLKKNFKKIKK